LKQKYWFFLTIPLLAALLGYCTNLTSWQATLSSALVNMWTWTLLPTRLVVSRNGDANTGSVRRGSLNGSSRRNVRQPTAVAVDEFELPDAVFGIAVPGGSLNSPQFNTATGLPMINDTLDVHGNIFGTRSADDLLNRDCGSERPFV